MVAKKYKDKEALVGSLHSKLDAATAIVITEYRGIKAGELVRLRRELRDAQVEVLVVKNSLLKRAAQGTNCESLVGELVGPTAVAVAYGDASEAAKLLAKGESDFAPFNLQSGIIENSVLDASGIAMIAKLPGKAEMHRAIRRFARRRGGGICDGHQRGAERIRRLGRSQSRKRRRCGVIVARQLRNQLFKFSSHFRMRLRRFSRALNQGRSLSSKVRNVLQVLA